MSEQDEPQRIPSQESRSSSSPSQRKVVAIWSLESQEPGMGRQTSGGSGGDTENSAAWAQMSTYSNASGDSRKDAHSLTEPPNPFKDLERSRDTNPLSQYLSTASEDDMRTESCTEKIRRYLHWFYDVPRTQRFNLQHLRIMGTCDRKFVDIVQNLMNVRCADALDLDDVTTMLWDTRLQWSFFDIVDADVPRRWVLSHFSILSQRIALSMEVIAYISSVYCSLIYAYDPVLQFDDVWNPQSDTYKTLQRFDIVLDAMFFVGTLTALRTTFVDTTHNVETSEPYKIWWKTVKSISFWMDLASCLPSFVVYAFPIEFSLHWLFLKVCTRLRFSLASLLLLNHNRQSLQIESFWQQIVRLLLFLVLLGHIVGCVWYRWCSASSSVSATILDHPLLEESAGGRNWAYPWNADQPLFLYYSYFSKTGLYLSLGIIVQGYSFTENALITVLAPIGSVINAYVLSACIVLVGRKTALETHSLEQVASLKQAISTQNLPATMQLRLMAYHTQKRVHRCRSQTENVFRGLSSQLHFELNLVLYCNLLLDAEIFKKAHPRVIRQFVLVFEDKLFLPGDYVCRYDDEGSEMYFICKGLLDVSSESYVLLSQMKKGQHFGEVALLTGQRRTAYVQAKVFCMLASLSKANFDNIMREYPQQYEVIMQQMSAKRRQWMQNLVKQQRDTAQRRQSTRKSFLLSGGFKQRYDDSGDPDSPKATISGLSKESTVTFQGAGGRDSDSDTGTEDANAKVPKGRPSVLAMVIPSGAIERDPLMGVNSKIDEEKRTVSKQSSASSKKRRESNASRFSEVPMHRSETTSSESSSSESSEDSDEDIEALVNAVSKQCSMALNGNEKICTRLKEIAQRQSRSAERAGRMSTSLAKYSIESYSEERAEMMEAICDDVDDIQRIIKEFSEYDNGGEDDMNNFHSHAMVGVLEQEGSSEEEESVEGEDPNGGDDVQHVVSSRTATRRSLIHEGGDDVELTVL